MRTISIAGVSMLSFAWMTGCAGPVGPPLGLGPELDSVVSIGPVVLAAVLLYRRFGAERKSCGCGGGTIASRGEEIARERYARGELTAEEYTRMVRDLSN